MTKPDDIPLDVWATALGVSRETTMRSIHGEMAPAVFIARAILAQRENLIASIDDDCLWQSAVAPEEAIKFMEFREVIAATLRKHLGPL